MQAVNKLRWHGIIMLFLFLSFFPAALADAALSDTGQRAESFEFDGIHGFHWLPEGGQCQSVILCIHGVSMWSGSFRQFGEQMAQANVSTYAIDLPGFGPYARIGGHWTEPDPEKSMVAIKHALEYLHSQHPGKPIFLLGESMGGCLAMRAAADFPEQIDGIICSAPAWKIYKVRRLLVLATLSWILHSHRLLETVIVGLVKRASKDPNLLARWQSNKEYRLRFSHVQFLRGMDLFAKTPKFAPRVKALPVLVVQGLSDRLVKPRGAAILFKRLSTLNKELLVAGNSAHLIFEEIKPEPDLDNLLLQWTQRQSNPKINDPEYMQMPTGVLHGKGNLKKAKQLFRLAGIEKPIILPSFFKRLSADAAMDFKQ